MFGSEIAIALSCFGTRFADSECQAVKSFASESPLALTDHVWNRLDGHLSNGSPTGELGFLNSGGGCRASNLKFKLKLDYFYKLRAKLKLPQFIFI
jgi:hypothetical protein